jgi:hypothetical protein
MKFFFILFLNSVFFVNTSLANDLSVWTNEDLCRWVDSISIPEPISMEINMREVTCYESMISNQAATELPNYSEHGTVFPSPVIQIKKKASGFNFIINYKITL